jgi:hypothetical protein
MENPVCPSAPYVRRVLDDLTGDRWKQIPENGNVNAQSALDARSSLPGAPVKS